MGKIDSVKDVYASISAIRTLLDNYPDLEKSDNLLNLLNSQNSLGFIIHLLQIMGLTSDDFINWLSKLLCGTEVISADGSIIDFELRDSDDGFLNTIEAAIKALLLVNVKNLFTCSINPLIPKDVLKFPKSNGLDGRGIVIPLSSIDAFNVLQHHPSKGLGKNLYFDNLPPSNDFWKSTDFNVFLWYIINKGSDVNEEGLKKIWDNRISVKDKFINDIFKTNFFNTYAGNNTYILQYQPQDRIRYKIDEKKNGEYDNIKDKYLKKQYLIVDYNEIDPTTATPNTLTIWLNGDRYAFNPDNIEGGNFLTKTVFEFNYDYIYSLKLFNSKTIVANVINAIIGLTRSAGASIINGKFTLEQEIIAKEVEKVITNLIENDDITINDCSFNFSNENYEKLINDAENKYYNNYQFGNTKGSLDETNINTINEAINNIDSVATLDEQESVIKGLVRDISDTLANDNNDEYELKGNFDWGENIVFELLKGSITQIVLQVLSPKVMLLYALNAYFMGDITDGNFSSFSIENFFKGLSNLITSIVKQVINLIINKLMEKILEKLKELLYDMVRILVKERIDYYLEIIERLLALISNYYDKIKDNSNSYFSNVTYADIVKPTETPKKDKC